MKIILLKDIPKVGKKWDVKNVADGFAQNSLIPRRLAEAATAAAVARATSARATAETSRATSAAELTEHIKKITAAHIEITAKANEQGHLFAALHESDIISAIKEKTGIALAPEILKLDHPIKTTGEHDVEIIAGEGQRTSTTLRITVRPS